MTPPIKIILSAVMVMVFTAITANADVITVTGSTQGNFNGGTTSTNPTLGNILTALEFQGQPFSTPVTTGLPAVQVQVGSFDLRTFRAFNFNGDVFNLVVTFTAPPGTPGGPQTFTANLSGIITVLGGSESITIDFTNTPQVFSYNGGFFTFGVNDIPSLNEQSGFVGLTANISATETPEPISMLLMGSGLAGVAVKLRKRRAK